MLAVITAAAEAVVQVAGEVAHPPSSGGGGLPQLNPHDFPPQLIWLALSFGLFYLLMSKLALPRIAEVLEERSGRIARDLETASKLKGETDQALADYEKALSDARSNASGIAKDMRDRMSAEAEAEKSKVESELAGKIKAAEGKIAETKAKALASVDDIAADTASAIVGKLLGQDISVEDVRRALSSSGGK